MAKNGNALVGVGMLLAVRDYIKLHVQVSMKDLIRHFKKSEEQLQPMLDKWVGKGQVEVVNTVGCGSGACGSCPLKCGPMYRFIHRLAGIPVSVVIE